jgi:hypothetical protein
MVARRAMEGRGQGAMVARSSTMRGMRGGAGDTGGMKKRRAMAEDVARKRNTDDDMAERKATRVTEADGAKSRSTLKSSGEDDDTVERKDTRITSITEADAAKSKSILKNFEEDVEARKSTGRKAAMAKEVAMATSNSHSACSPRKSPSAC